MNSGSEQIVHFWRYYTDALRTYSIFTPRPRRTCNCNIIKMKSFCGTESNPLYNCLYLR